MISIVVVVVVVAVVVVVIVVVVAVVVVMMLSPGKMISTFVYRLAPAMDRISVESKPFVLDASNPPKSSASNDALKRIVKDVTMDALKRQTGSSPGLPPYPTQMTLSSVRKHFNLCIRRELKNLTRRTTFG